GRGVVCHHCFRCSRLLIILVVVQRCAPVTGLRRSTQVVAARVDGSQRLGQQLGHLGELPVHIVVAGRPLLVGFVVRGVHDPRRFTVCGLHHLGLRDQPCLLVPTVLHSTIVGLPARLHHPLGFRPGAFGQVLVLGFRGGDHPVRFGTRVRQYLIGTLLCFGHQPFRFGVGIRHGRFGLRTVITGRLL